MLKGNAFAITTLMIIGGCPLIGQQSDASDLSDLLQVNTKMYATFQAASGKALPLRESPGIVSLVTRDEIVASGARDLMDILRFVPGFDFGVDIQGVVGLAVRGSWAHEGKALLLVDGIEINEILNGTTAFGGHILADSIERVEIIRGPGSAIYGGFAGLAVINVVTRNGQSLSGFSADLSAGRSEQGGWRRQATLAGGGATETLDWSITGALGATQRSDRDYTSLDGEAYDMNGQSGILSRQLNLGLRAGGFRFRGLLDRYALDERDHYDTILPVNNRTRFNTQALSTSYELSLSQHTSLTFHGAYKEQTPWTVTAPGLDGYWRNASRTLGGISFAYDPNPFFHLLLGMEKGWDEASVNLEPSVKAASFQNQAFYAQGIFYTSFGTWTAGGRLENHSQYGRSFAPRLAWTKAWTLAHVKLLAARAFRTPTIENLNIAPDIQPEKTTTLEAEVGFNLAPGLYLSVNLFDNAIKDPIIYTTLDEDDFYLNASRTGTRGAELNAQWSGTWGSLVLSHAYHRPHRNEVELYQVPEHDQNMLGLAAHKTTVQAILNLRPRLTLSPSLVHSSTRHGWTYDSSTAESRIQPSGPWTDANLFLRYASEGDRWSLGFGIYNLFNTGIAYLQPYDGGHGPLPAPGREVALKVSIR